MVKADLDEYCKKLIEAEKHIFKRGIKRKNTYYLGDIRYEIGRTRANVGSLEFLHHFFYSRYIDDTCPYTIMDLGAGLGYSGSLITGKLSTYLDQNESITLTLTNLTQPPEFELPASSDKVKYKHISEFCGELISEEFKEKYNLLYSENTIQWSKYPDIFLKNIYNMIKPGGIAILTTLEHIGKHEMRNLIENSPFKYYTARQLVGEDSLQGEKMYFMYKPTFNNSKDELNDYCRKNNFISAWKLIDLNH